MNKLATVLSVAAIAVSNPASPAEASPEKLTPQALASQQFDKIPEYVDDAHADRLKSSLVGAAEDLLAKDLSQGRIKNDLTKFNEGLMEAVAAGTIYKASAEQPSATKKIVLAVGILVALAALFAGAGLSDGRRRR